MISWLCDVFPKGSSSEMTHALKKLRCQRRFGLTGTPLQNRLNELWCIMDWSATLIALFYANVY